MKMPLFGIGMQSKTPVITAKLLTNVYAEYRPQGEKTSVVGIGFPGYDLFTDFGATPVRGMEAVEQNDLLYTVHRGVFWELNNAGAQINRGMIGTTSGSVGMSHNQTQVMVVDGVTGYIYDITTPATPIAAITAPGFPANPTSVTFLNGFFIVGLDNGRFYTSSINDGTAWDALDFATAESSPDRLIRVFADHGELILMGDISCEFWGASLSADFPFAKIQGADQEWGLAARQSVVKYDDSIAFLCKNRMGEVIVGKLQGHALTKISTPDLDKIVNSYAVTSDAVGFSYLLGGHPMYQLNFPAAGESWSYDGLTGIWSKRKSEDTSRQRCEFGTQYLSRTVMADYDNGRLYKLNPNSITENGATIEAQIVGEHWDSELTQSTIDRLRLDFEVGTGPATEPAAQAMLSISRDGGQTWGSEMWKSMGLRGHYAEYVEWRRLGTSRRWTMKVRITDLVSRVLMGAYVNTKN